MEQPKPLVSVVIIFLNAEPFIQEAIESVLAQTYTAWDLWLVDDGSSDGSSTLARQYAARYPDQVHYLDHPAHQNQGMSASRNLGVRQSRGPYIAFLDADDVWHPTTLAEQVALLETHPRAALVYGPIEWWYNWTGQREDRARDYIERLGVPANTLVEPPTLVPLFLQDKAAVPSGSLVRREAVERVGGFEESFRDEYEDQVFCAKLCLTMPVFAAGQCWYRYRQHQASCVAVGQATGQTDEARRVFLTWLNAYLSDQGVSHPGVWRALRHELWPYRHPRLRRWLIRAQPLWWRLQGMWRRTVKGGVDAPRADYRLDGAR